MSSPPVVITGATGFIGAAVVNQLLEAGRSVIALVRPATDRTRLPEHDDLQVVEYEQLDAVELADELRVLAPSAFLHLGWAGVEGAARRQVDQAGINVPVTIASVELASAAGCLRWVGVGSQAEYGSRFDAVREDALLRPDSSYGRAKVKAWAAAQDAAQMYGLSHAWARVFSVFGPGDHSSAVVPYTINALLSGRTPTLGAGLHDWDLLYVDDAAAALIALVDSAANGPFNIAAGTARPLRDVIQLIDGIVGGEVHPVYDEAPSTPVAPLLADITRIRAEAGWMPTTTLEDGISRTVSAMRESLITPLTGGEA